MVKVHWEQDKVIDAVKLGSNKALQRAGAYVRSVVRNSIKKRKNPDVSSEPGNPPHTHGSHGYKDTIVFAVDGNTAVIGPIAKAGREPLGQIHEFGGTRTIKGRRREYAVGKSGPIRVSVNGKPVFAKLKTDRQVSLARTLDKKLYPDADASKTRRYPARPHMAPALEKSLPRLNGFWANVVNS